MVKMVEMTGKRFGRLTVVSRAPNCAKKKQARWHCACECGGTAIVLGNVLRRNEKRSCGCMWADIDWAPVADRNRTHGHARTKLYSIWANMKDRCHNPNNQAYKYYGARGIAVCERWRNSFEAFLADMGERPHDRMTLEREDNDKGYSPDNCKWATYTEQARNRRPAGTALAHV